MRAPMSCYIVSQAYMSDDIDMLDLFSGLIQTTVFISLSAIFIGQEVPEELSINTLEIERRNS